MGDQMEIDPDLYGSSPQPTSHPLFAPREPPASLSSTKSFAYDGAWFTPVSHTASIRKGSKPSWIWAHGDELRDAKGRKHGRCNHCKASKKTQINSCATNNNRANLHLQAAPNNLRLSAECERIFSGAKLLISPNRNSLADDITEAAECLRIWWMRGIIED